MAQTVPLHPTESRGYRELYAASHGLARHWSRLVRRERDPATRDALGGGIAAARRLISELSTLSAENDPPAGPAALGLGGRIADFHNLAADRFLERNQALRVAALEPRHVRLLLAYLATVADGQGAGERASLCRGWEDEFRAIEEGIEGAIVVLAGDPDAAIQPVDRSAAGRAAQRVAVGVGAAGEWVDRRVGRRG